MPNKARYVMKCAFCGGSRSGDAELEVVVTMRDIVGSQRQIFGAHQSCMSNAMAPRFSIEADLLRDDKPNLALVEPEHCDPSPDDST